MIMDQVMHILDMMFWMHVLNFVGLLLLGGLYILLYIKMKRDHSL